MIPSPTLRQVTELAATAGWQQAVATYSQCTAPLRREYTLRHAVRDSLGDFRYLPAGEGSRNVTGAGTALNVGSDWGTLTIGLARIFDHVVALDAQPETLRFARLRAQQQGISNVTCVTGSACAIPMLPDTCALVLLADALEWAPLTHPKATPAVCQCQALAEVHRVLAPGGILHIQVENRFGYPYWLGARDLHTGLRFIPVLPRRLADIYSRLARGRAYREWLPSWATLRDMLASRGFQITQLYQVLPGYRDYSYTADFRTDRQLHFVIGQLAAHPSFHTWYRLLLQAPGLTDIARWTLPRFNIFAVKAH
jgi:ubiquinone/menaquinone biosynthesis C-methylase UbiE